MAAALIGHGRCPIGCGSHKARFSLSSSKLTVCTCNACNTQVFARSDRSDELLRANITQPANAPDDALPAGLPAAPPPAEPEPAAPPPPSPAPVEPPRKKPVAWGMLRGLES